MINTATTDYAQDDVHDGRSLVAIFPDKSSAREAASRLHEAAFHGVWIGVTHDPSETYGDESAGGTVVESSDESLGEKIGRFFTGDEAQRSLYDELTRHGVASTEALRIEDQIPAESAVLTVDGANHPEAAAATIEQCGGHVIAGEGFIDDESLFADSTVERRGSEVLGYGDPQRYARGTEVDDQRILQLRTERLNVDRRREASGEATIGKAVVETQQDFDVPVVREELFIQRRPVSDSSASAEGGSFGSERDMIRIPLMRERVVVTKRPVVSSEYVVGKRTVTETEHVSESTQEERLRVDGQTRESLGTQASFENKNSIN
jgi:uncharacterized protein (TIGR02271 family)